MEKRFPWGGVELMLSLKNGHVETATVYTDSMDENLSAKIKDALEGAEYGAHLPEKLAFLPDMREWLAEELPL